MIDRRTPLPSMVSADFTWSRPRWLIQRGLWLVGFAPVFAQLIGSAFNIWYNLVRIQPLLSESQHAIFNMLILGYNLLIYPIATGVWIAVILSLQPAFVALLQRQPVDPVRLGHSRRRVINLPWWGAGVAGVSWLGCIPTFLTGLSLAPDPLNPNVYFYLPVSLLISALIAVTHGVFAVELLSQQLLYPVFFQLSKPAGIPGAFSLSLYQRGLLLAISSGICPIVSLLLLNAVPPPEDLRSLWFALAVGLLGIVFGLVSAWMVGHSVVEPVKALQQAAQAVASGNLQARVNLQRADEFGPLIDEFNEMVTELQEKQHLQAMFGRHVGEQAARQILQRDPSLGGVEQELTVVFADIRSFTARCVSLPPQQVVALLNLFLTEMVDIVEQRYGGMVNKFLGDGFMALFGIGDAASNHALHAVLAAQEMLTSVQTMNQQLVRQGHEPLAIGIGIHTGYAVVGSIGSPQRLEYTAIGDTVNIAARVEALTKTVQVPLVFTEATRAALPANLPVCQLPAQRVKGQPLPLEIYSLEEYLELCCPPEEQTSRWSGI